MKMRAPFFRVCLSIQFAVLLPICAVADRKTQIPRPASNEIFRLPMRGYFSLNGGTNWGGVDLPLPPPQGSNGIDFGSDPSLAFDTRGNLLYGYIVIFFGNGNGVNGSEIGVARSTDGGQTYSSVNFFGFEGGSSHFNDK